MVRGQAGNFVIHLAGPPTSFTTVATTQNHHDSQLQALESSTGNGGASHNHELMLRTDSDVPAGELIRLHSIDVLADITLYDREQSTYTYPLTPPVR